MENVKTDKPKKNRAAQSLTALRNQILTPQRRREIAVQAAQARWGAKEKRKK